MEKQRRELGAMILGAEPCETCGEMPRADCPCFDGSNLYCQGCGAAPHDGGHYCGPTCPVGVFPCRDLPTKEQFDEAVGILAQSRYNAERVPVANYLRNAYRDAIALLPNQQQEDGK
jgi:hypothetical protein